MRIAQFRKAALVLVALTSTPAMAQQLEDKSTEGDQGFYLAIGVSRISADASSEFDGASLEFSDSDNAYNFRAGYMFTNWIGIEAGYYDFGVFEDSLQDTVDDFVPGTDVDLDLKGYSLQLVGNIPISFIDLYFKGGIVRLEGEASASAFGLSYSADESTNEPFAAVGVELDMGMFNLFGEYSRVMDTDDVEIDMATVGVKLEF